LIHVSISNHNPEQLHKEIYAKTPRKLAFSQNAGYEPWRAELKDKLAELLGMSRFPDTAAVPEVIVISLEEHPDFKEIRFEFESEPGYFAPCHLLIPKKGKAPYPAVVCLQGHNSGMHLSLERFKYEEDSHYIPHMLEWFEMQDLAGLIAPRKLLVVAGREDDIFPIKDTESCFGGIAGIYAKAGYEENCRLVIGEGEYRFYPDEAWPVFTEMSGWGVRG